ncbi:TetR/AcrR family transcriptional regulator [Ktedonobacter racemifer]|uniref:Transcriptional regulator, TetR family n=1 Tax=Ktedonobacter racemifer DSM 44963 TaxID=485913 RepID=D6TXY9_KTERA|nr:TetR/AcrR family transcriptional regulator [Ktedonobacter racemifer]EFH84985.1 transcriptional regulator, TetR family [Ktedonobacter racemifer DSM 44963]
MSHPTRQALVDAGLDLATSGGLRRLTVDAVVNKAGVAKGTFYVHFPDRTAFLVALHVQFYERLRDALLQVIAPLSPGAERLRKSMETYLDGCLHERAVKALLLEARSEPLIAAEVQRRRGEFAAIAQADFQAMGWPDAEFSARFFAALGAETALVELETGRNEAARRALWRFARIEEAPQE